jgi:photosystem II stability/assembly factor-like uncharacterized protein
MGPHRSAVVYVVLLCALALCCAAPALALEPAGDGWYWASPQPQGQFLNAVDFGDGLNVWAVGDAGTIMHSYDAGVTWRRQAAPTEVALGSVAFTSALSGWAVGGDGWSSDTPRESSHGIILHTADGGVTWVAQKTPASAVSDLAFVDDQQGWAVGGRGLILHTADGGQTWVTQRSGVTRNILSVAFTDALHGYAGCADGVLLTTADGGASWKRARSSADCSGIVSLAVGADGKLWGGARGAQLVWHLRSSRLDGKRRPLLAVPGRQPHALDLGRDGRRLASLCRRSSRRRPPGDPGARQRRRRRHVDGASHQRRDARRRRLERRRHAVRRW